MPEVNFDLNLADPQFWAGLVQVVVINILLSGDNALVIALASHSLPRKQRIMAMIGGSIGAVALRIILIFVIAWLLTIPVIKVLGSALLIWIGAQMMVSEDERQGGIIKAHAGPWAALRTIVVADAVMSLDNVLAIAAAAQGNFPLLLIGLLISIPMVVFGSMLFLKLLDRFSVLVVAGAALVGSIAGEVIVTDPSIAAWIAAHAQWLHVAGPIGGIAVVLAIGFWMRRRAEAKARPLIDLAVEEK